MIRKMRVRRGVAETPVVRYENRKTGRAVTLVATIHVGTSAYFARLQEILAGLEAAGALVCYEGIQPAAAEEWAAASGEERTARGFANTMTDRLFQAVCWHLGWVEQAAALRYSPAWRNVDTTDLELVRQAQPHNAREVSADANDAYTGLTPEQLGVVLSSGAALVIRLVALDWCDLLQRWAEGAESGAGRHVGRAVVDGRNRAALAGLPADTDAVLLWGSGHLPGLAAGLRSAGYRRRGITWVPVGKLPDFWPSLKAFVAWARTPSEGDGTPAPGAGAAPDGQPA